MDVLLSEMKHSCYTTKETMMDFNLSTDLTRKGTTITVEGKPIKLEIECIDFDLYKEYEYDQLGNPIEELYRFRVKVVTKEIAEDGTEKTVCYHWMREDEEEEIKDSKTDMTPTSEMIIRDLANKMMGKKSIL